MRRSRAIASVLLSSLAAALPWRAGAQVAPDKIRFAGPSTEDGTNVVWAIRTGAFTRAGIEADYTGVPSGAVGVAAVSAGSYDLARTSLSAVLAAHLRGLDLVIVAPANIHDVRTPLALLQIPVDSTVKSAAELNGKTAAVPSLGDLNTVSIKAWMDKNGGDWRTLKLVELPNSAIEAALQQHRVDAAVMQSPQVFISLAAGTTKTLGDSWSAIAPRFLAGVYVARAEWIASNGPLVRRMLRVYQDASSYVMAHPAETAQDVTEVAKIELPNALKMRRTVYSTVLEPNLVQPVIDAAAKYGSIARAFPAREIFAFDSSK